MNAGQTIVFHFGVCNDGLGGKTGLYVDDVSLVVWRPTAPAEYRLYLPLIPKQISPPSPVGKVR